MSLWKHIHWSLRYTCCWNALWSFRKVVFCPSSIARFTNLSCCLLGNPFQIDPPSCLHQPLPFCGMSGDRYKSHVSFPFCLPLYATSSRSPRTNKKCPTPLSDKSQIWPKTFTSLDLELLSTKISTTVTNKSEDQSEMSKSSAVELFSTKLSTTTIHKSGQQPAISEPSALELLSVELFAAILHNITLKSDLNALSRSSRALYHRTTPEL